MPIWITAVNAAPGSPQPKQLGEDPQVGAAGDRQELGQALDGPEDHGLEEVDTRAEPTGGETASRGALLGGLANWPMQQRSLGATGLKVSRLGLGTLTWGRDTDEHEARDQLIAFAEAGGTLLDTAAGYGDGASEELIGSLLGDVVARDEIVLATKAGISRPRAASA